MGKGVMIEGVGDDQNVHPLGVFPLKSNAVIIFIEKSLYYYFL